MRFFDSIQRARALYAADKEAHIGDIAVLKTDAFGVRIRPSKRHLLDPVRGWVPPIDLAALAQLPKGSFGRAYADFMADNGLSPFVITEAIDDDMRRRNAFGIRYATTHDMFHVLLGFDTSWPGELGVLGFAVGQGYTVLQTVGAVLAALIYPFLSGFRLRALWRAWSHGHRLGQQTPFLLGLRLEDQFERDLAELRAELGLADAPPVARLAA